MTAKNHQENLYVWDICGHEKIVDYLKTSLANQRLSHAYIFAGSAGLGKSAVADKFIKTLFCTGQTGYRPCEACPACHQINQRVYPDLFAIKRLTDEKTGKLKRELLVDQIRDLKSQLSQVTLLGGYKIALIEEAELLNINSANSLLKVLEEPSAKTIIILLARDLDQLPATVKSRSQILNFLPVSRETIKNYLLAKEVSEDRADKISRLALGRPGLALRLASDNEEFNRTLSGLETFTKLLSLPVFDRLIQLDDLMDFQKDETLNLAALSELLQLWQLGSRNLLMKHLGIERQSIVGGSRQQSSGLSLAQVLRVNQMIERAKDLLAVNISSKNILENLLINL